MTARTMHPWTGRMMQRRGGMVLRRLGQMETSAGILMQRILPSNTLVTMVRQFTEAEWSALPAQHRFAA